jgi:transcription elongation factor Elf1
MSKLLKDTHVYIPCPACGKVEGVKLKWAQGHKTLKCGKCREKVDLRANPARSLIARTGEALVSFEAVLDALYAEAKKTAKAMSPKKDKKEKKGKQKQGKKAKSRKKPAKRNPKAPLAPLPPETGGSDPV